MRHTRGRAHVLWARLRVRSERSSKGGRNGFVCVSGFFAARLFLGGLGQPALASLFCVSWRPSARARARRGSRRTVPLPVDWRAYLQRPLLSPSRTLVTMQPFKSAHPVSMTAARRVQGMLHAGVGALFTSICQKACAILWSPTILMLVGKPARRAHVRASKRLSTESPSESGLDQWAANCPLQGRTLR